MNLCDLTLISEKELVEKGYDKLKTFGAGRDIPQRDWQDYLLQMLNMGYFEVAYNENNHLKITTSGAKVLYGQEKAMLVVIKREEAEPKPKGRSKKKEEVPLFKVAASVPVGKRIRLCSRNFVPSASDWPTNKPYRLTLSYQTRPCTCSLPNAQEHSKNSAW